MKSVKLVVLILGILLSSIAYFSWTMAAEQFVVFNGNFSEGVTLYSQTYSFNQTNMTARDAYPLAEKAVCTMKSTCLSYNYNKTMVCKKYDFYGTRCIQTVQILTKTSCKTSMEKRVCQARPIVCYNPSGSRTNQLDLANFQYTIDNSTWLSVQYSKISFSNVSLTFRVNIPLNCTPAYNINQSIKLEF